MINTLVNKIPNEFRDKLPVIVFFVKGKDNKPIRRKDIAFAPSDFYNTQKMRCFEFYKPAFL